MNPTNAGGPCNHRPNLLAIFVLALASLLSGCVARSPQRTPRLTTPTPAPSGTTVKPLLPTVPVQLFAPEATMPDTRLAQLTLPVAADTDTTPLTFIPGASAERSSDVAQPEAGVTDLPAPATQPAATPGCPKRGTRVLMIGDSLVVGLGPVVRKLARACNTPFHYRGVVGSHVTQWVQDHWLTPQLQRAQPDVVMVSLGGNDFRRTDPEKVRVAVSLFVEKIAASGARLVWISPPTMPFPDDIGVRDMWRDAIGGEADVDWFAAERLEIPRAKDRIHPNMPGNRMLSAALWAWTSATTN